MPNLHEAKSVSGKKKAHELKESPRDTGQVSLGHPPGQPGDYRPVPQGFLVVFFRKTGIFAGTPAGCPRDTRRPGGFQKFDVIFSYVPFLLPKAEIRLRIHAFWHPDFHEAELARHSERC